MLPRFCATPINYIGTENMDEQIRFLDTIDGFVAIWHVKKTSRRKYVMNIEYDIINCKVTFKIVNNTKKEYLDMIKSLKYSILMYCNVAAVSEEEFDNKTNILSVIEKNTTSDKDKVITLLNIENFMYVSQLLADIATLPMAEIGKIIHTQNNYIEYLENLDAVITADEDMEDKKEEFIEEYSDDVKEISNNAEINHLQGLL